MAISRVLTKEDTISDHTNTDTTDVSGIISFKDYMLVHVVSWHRGTTEPVLSAIEFYDRITPANQITLSLLSTQTRNEATTDGGYCTVSTYGGQYTNRTPITSGRLAIDFTGPTTVDYVFIDLVVYRKVATNPTYIIGTIDENNGDGTTHDFGSATLDWPNFWLNSFIVLWDTTSNMGTYSLDIPSGFTLLQSDTKESSPGINYTMYVGMLDDGPYPISGTVAPSPADTSTNAIQWISVLIPIYGDDSFPQDGGMGVFF